MPTPHVYSHANISADLVSNFANAPHEEQLEALWDLRLRSEFQYSELMIPVLAVTIGYLGLLWGALWGDGQGWGNLLDEVAGTHLTLKGVLLPWVQLVLPMVALFLVVTVMFLSLRQTVGEGRERRARAAAWLRTYERELDRRQGATGRAANAWRKAHPIQWRVVEKPRIPERAILSVIPEQRRQNRRLRKARRRADRIPVPHR